MASTCECGDEPSGSIKNAGNFFTSCGHVSFLGRIPLYGVSLFVSYCRSSVPKVLGCICVVSCLQYCTEIHF